MNVVKKKTLSDPPSDRYRVDKLLTIENQLLWGPFVSLK